MELWRHAGALRACALAQLGQGGWTAPQDLAARLDAPEDALAAALDALVADGCAETCLWPRGERMLPHYRRTDFGGCLAQSLRGRWLEERQALDRFLL